jgi:hypothetical protein
MAAIGSARRTGAARHANWLIAGMARSDDFKQCEARNAGP